MYTNFFGFKERPFQLVPNPEYLFLSRSHEEAIAHLNYTIANGDGFVEITGEVGTGKTTLCRVFLESLDENTEVAYIFNPRLNGLELLKTINDDFGIDSKPDNAKELIDTLNTFLMEKKSAGKNVILLIDEAQNLDREVLEQLRLLSNLETNTSKLLQIILVGQPELRDLLDAYELRQLRQRITLCWYLTPLTRAETREYIRHRVNIASKKTVDMFSETAYGLIYKYSGGIPRLINIACDRALLTAYGLNKHKVSGPIARDSIAELTSRGGSESRVFTRRNLLIGSAALVCLLLVAAFVFKIPAPLFNPDLEQPTMEPAKNTADAASQGETVVTPAKPTPAVTAPAKFEDFIGRLELRASRSTAVRTLLDRWQAAPALNRYLDNMDDDPAFFRFAAAHNNFQLLEVNRDLDLVTKLNLPAVLGFLPPGASAPRYLTLVEMTADEAVLKNGTKGETFRVPFEELRGYWSGNAYILWKNFFNYTGRVSTDAPPESVFTLKLLLRDIGFDLLPLDRTFGDACEEAVRTVQRRHGIEVDGIVGDKTKIVIYNDKKDLKIPHLWPAPGSGGEKAEGIKE